MAASLASGRGLVNLQRNYLRRANVLVRANFGEQRVTRGRIEIQDSQRRSASLVPAQGHSRDIYSVVAQERSYSADNAGPIRILQHEHNAMRAGLHWPAVHVNDPRRRAKEGARD